MQYIELGVIAILLAYIIVKDIVYFKYLRNIQTDNSTIKSVKDKGIGFKRPKIEIDKARFLTEKKVDELLREELGEDDYKQMISDQNYGMVG